MPVDTRPLDPEADWMFFHEFQPVSAADRAAIRPLTEASAVALWDALVSADPRQRHPMLLDAGHWDGDQTAVGPNWQSCWNDRDRPDEVATFLRRALDWPDDAEVFVVGMRERATRVPWGVFLRAWRAFLFEDEGPMVLRPDDPGFAGFGPTGLPWAGRRG